VRLARAVVVRGRVDDATRAAWCWPRTSACSSSRWQARQPPEERRRADRLPRARARGDGRRETLRPAPVCEAHAGAVPVFVHVLLPGHEVVVRARGVAVDATGDLVAELETLLGAGHAAIELCRTRLISSSRCSSSRPHRRAAGRPTIRAVRDEIAKLEERLARYASAPTPA
jgi:hypothetical protein